MIHFQVETFRPSLLVRIYFTTLEHKNIYMIHGMRGYQKVAKSCNRIYIPQKCVCNYIYIYVSRSCALYPLLIHILLYHSCGILVTNIVSCWCAGTFPDCRWSTNPIVLRLLPQLFLFVFCCNKTRKTILLRLLLRGKASSCSFFCFFGFFCFRTISLGHSGLTEKGSLRAEWGQDRKAPWRVERIDTRGQSILTC